MGSNRILLVGPSSRIKQLTPSSIIKYKNSGYKVLSFSNSFAKFAEMGISPDYFSFIDPFTVGYKLDFFEKTKLFDKTTLLIHDIYKDQFKRFYDFGFTCNKLESSKHICDRTKSLNFFNSFEKVKYPEGNVKCVYLSELSDQIFDYKKQLVLFSGAKMKSNTDKLSCFLLPMIINTINNIQEIRIVGFGDFDTDRYMSHVRNNTGGYQEYLNTFRMMKNNTAYNIANNAIDFSFVNENFYSKEMSKKI